MPITTEAKVVARCDVSDCKAVRYGTEAEPPPGFHATVTQVTDGPDGVQGREVEVYACTLAHLKKAVAEKLEAREGTEISFPVGEVAA